MDHLREEYRGTPLVEDGVAADPIEQFRRWFGDAASSVRLANAMTLATVDADGRVSARVVLLKSYDERGFVFYTNYDSRKGRAIAHHPAVALCFFWPELDRQIRIEGDAERVATAESDQYFGSRPVTSNVSAIASQQSRVVASRNELEERVAALTRELGDAEPQRPEHWGGYRVVPVSIELWQGRQDRLHDRLRYLRVSDGWRIERLAP